jgi:PKD repeat protein
VPNTGVTINTTISHQNPTITFPSSGTFSVTLIDSNSVGTSSVTNVVTITVNTPTVSYTLTPDSVPHVWDVYINYSANVTNAIWYWGDGTDTSGLYAGHSYDSAGTYNICVTAYSACGDSASYCQNDSIYRTTNTSMIKVKVLQSTAGIQQFANSKEQVIIYPNPNNGSFVIEPIPSLTLPQGKGILMQVYDVNGKLVLSQTINGKTSIDASSLNEGIYNISLQSNEGVVNKRLVIVR